MTLRGGLAFAAGLLVWLTVLLFVPPDVALGQTTPRKPTAAPGQPSAPIAPPPAGVTPVPAAPLPAATPPPATAVPASPTAIAISPTAGLPSPSATPLVIGTPTALDGTVTVTVIAAGTPSATVVIAASPTAAGAATATPVLATGATVTAIGGTGALASATIANGTAGTAPSPGIGENTLGIAVLPTPIIIAAAQVPAGTSDRTASVITTVAGAAVRLNLVVPTRADGVSEVTVRETTPATMARISSAGSLVARAFDIEVRGADGRVVRVHDRPITIVVAIESSDIVAAAGDRRRLRIARWDDVTGVVELLSTRVDEVSGTLTAETLRTSTFMITVAQGTTAASAVPWMIGPFPTPVIPSRMPRVGSAARIEGATMVTPDHWRIVGALGVALAAARVGVRVRPRPR